MAIVVYPPCVVRNELDRVFENTGKGEGNVKDRVDLIESYGTYFTMMRERTVDGIPFTDFMDTHSHKFYIGGRPYSVPKEVDEGWYTFPDRCFTAHLHVGTAYGDEPVPTYCVIYNKGEGFKLRLVGPHTGYHFYDVLNIKDAMDKYFKEDRAGLAEFSVVLNDWIKTI
jgi:hypothetical protein